MQSLKSIIETTDVSTRGKRRKTVALVIMLLERILNTEETYQNRIPLNLQCGEAYEASEYSIAAITDAIGPLYEAYE